MVRTCWLASFYALKLERFSESGLITQARHYIDES